MQDVVVLRVHPLVCPAHTNAVLARGKWSSGSPVTSEPLLWWERPNTLRCLCSYGMAALKFSVFESLQAHPTCFITAFPPWDHTWGFFEWNTPKYSVAISPPCAALVGSLLQLFQRPLTSSFPPQSLVISPDLSLADSAAFPIKQTRQIISL